MATVQIGGAPSAEAIKEGRETIMEILRCINHDGKTIRKALDVLSGFMRSADVSNITISGCTFSEPRVEREPAVKLDH